MAVVAMWKCDRDNSMFASKKEAEEHDKMLELAENITALIDMYIDGVDEKSSEAIGILLSKHRESLARACKGKPEVLLAVNNGVADAKDAEDGVDSHAEKSVVTSIAEGKATA